MRQSASFHASKTLHDQLLLELRLGRQRARESLGALKSELRLEMSLEKGRQRDSHLAQTIKYQDLQSKIDTETSNGLASVEKLRHEILYSALGVLFTSAAAFFGYLRYFK